MKTVIWFGPQAARQLNAEYSVIARGGLGVYHNWNEASAGAELHALDYYKQTLYNYPAPLWNFSKWQPDVVVIALGTNDTNGQWNTSASSLTTTAFEAAYLDLVNYIEAQCPSAQIFCMEPIPAWCMAYDGAGTGTLYTGQTYIKTLSIQRRTQGCIISRPTRRRINPCYYPEIMRIPPRILQSRRYETGKSDCPPDKNCNGLVRGRYFQAGA